MKKIIMIVGLFWAVNLSGQEIITDRPDQTESPNAVPIGILQIESGVLFEQNEDILGSERLSLYPTNLFRLGIANRLELRLVTEVASIAVKDKENGEEDLIKGMTNTQLGFKYQITDNDAPLVLGYMFHYIFPSGTEGLSNKQNGVLMRLNASYDLDDKRNLSANFGYINEELGGPDIKRPKNYDGNLTYTFVYGQGLSDRVGVYLEAYGDYVNFKKWSNNADAGLTYLLKENIQLDYSFGWGLTETMNYHSVGISIYFPK